MAEGQEGAQSMIAEWLRLVERDSFLLGLLVGVLVSAALTYWIMQRRQRQAERVTQEERDGLRSELAVHEQEVAVLKTRLEEQQRFFQNEKEGLEKAEKRLTESFERLAGKVFDERSQRFTELSEKQLGGILKPLTKDLERFRNRVDETHREDIRQQAALRERLLHLEGLNERLNEEARNLTRALTSDVKAQGSWGEQQLEKLLELSGLRKGENYHTQYSVTGQGGERLQPDLVLLLPENRTIVMDSKVSLTAWTRLQAAEDEDRREVHLASHVQSLRAHIDGLSAKNYSSVEELNALDFVLMFVPIEAALIAALRADPTLPEYALKKRVALLSPANFLATVRTVASVWMIHKQNTNAQDIASRAGLLYDKFVGFTENLRQLGSRLDQARKAYDDAFSQLSTGAGNLVGQTEKLRTLGAKHSKQLEAGLVEKATDGGDDDEGSGLRLVKPEDE
ncbi:MAG: DNA recombination protein RmuC [Xanthomonadales bacterium]|nr:DNA recombination protein RmuC [Xanthomonadales bacterium]